MMLIRFPLALKDTMFYIGVIQFIDTLRTVSTFHNVTGTASFD